MKTTSDYQSISIIDDGLLKGVAIERNDLFYNYQLRFPNGIVHECTVQEVILLEILRELKSQATPGAKGKG